MCNLLYLIWDSHTGCVPYNYCACYVYSHPSQQGLLVSYVVQYFDWPGLGMELLVHKHVQLKQSRVKNGEFLT